MDKIQRDRRVGESGRPRRLHKPEIAGSNPAPAILPQHYRPVDDFERRDQELIERAVAEWLSGKYDQIHLECFNEAEADMLKRRIHQIDPSVNLACSWLVFCNGKDK